MSEIRLLESGPGYKSLNPAPIIENVLVRKRGAAESEPCMALVDTASAVSSVPKSLIDKLGIKESKSGIKGLRMADDGTQEYVFAQCFQVDLEFCGQTVKLDSVIARGGLVRIGRDILKDSTLTVCWKKTKPSSMEIGSKQSTGS